MKIRFYKGTNCKVQNDNYYFSLNRDLDLDVGDIFEIQFTKFSAVFKYKVLDNNGLMLLVEEIKEEKSAKEMFEELGFKNGIVTSSEVIYEDKEAMGRKRRIYFIANGVHCTLLHQNKPIDGCYVDNKLLKAIQKQIEELGWE